MKRKSHETKNKKHKGHVVNCERRQKGKNVGDYLKEWMETMGKEKIQRSNQNLNAQQWRLISNPTEHNENHELEL